MLGIILSALLLAAAADPAAPAAAASAAPTAAAPARKPPPDPNEVVCWSEKVVGSHLPTKVCATRHERELMEREGRESLERNDRTQPSGLRPG